MTLEISAQVVTLEASVRVLTVGNRQITQSVANQLDKVNLWEIEPMGRVKIKGQQLAIGRRKSSGDLALAYNHRCNNICHLEDLEGVITEDNWLHPAPCGCSAEYRKPQHDYYGEVKGNNCPPSLNRLPIIEALPLIVLAGLR